MGKFSSARLILPVLFLFIGLLLGFYLGKNWPLVFEKGELFVKDESQETPPQIELSHQVGAWLVWWDQDRGFETLQGNRSLITSVKPFWYQVAADGTIEKYSGAEDEEILSLAKANGIKIIPVISNNHQPELVRPIIFSEKRTRRHIQNLVTLIKTKDYDGIEIDYESLKAGYRKKFSTFIQALAKAVHKEGKLLTVAVHAKTEKPGSWDGPRAQDWKALGEVCDQVKIMTYDYHWATSAAGAIAPLSWVEKVIKFAVSQIPKNKIYLGVPFYGYDWVGEQGAGVTWEDAQELIKRYKVSPKRDPASKERHFSYRKEGERHTVWFNDSVSLEAKLALVKRYELAGIGIWRIGREDPKIWAEIEEAFEESL